MSLCDLSQQKLTKEANTLKYWRGYLIAGIIALGTWVLTMVAKTYTQLVDMVYPYVSRIVMDYMASWSSGVEGCLWQILLLFAIALLVLSIVLMIVFRWNPIQWGGWVLTGVSILVLLNTGMYGLNAYAGPVSEDVRLEEVEYSVGSLERAAIYYRDMANQLAQQVSRNPDGSVDFPAFSQLADQAGESFHTLTYENTIPIFSGSTLPVKELGWTGFYEGVTGVTVGLTGEAAVNPNVPAVGLPFAICHEMAHRMCVYSCSEAEFSAFLACSVHSSPEFQYSGYLLAFRACYNYLLAINSPAGRDALSRVRADLNDRVLADMEEYNQFFGENATLVDKPLCDLLVSWHIQQIADAQDQEEENTFDPLDESDDRFQDLFPS